MIIDIFTSSNFGVDNGLLKQERDPAHKVSSEIGEVFQTRSLPGLIEGVPTVGPTAPPKQATFKVKTTLRFLYLLSFLTLQLHGTQPPWDSALLVQRSGYQSLRVLRHLCPLSSFKTTLMLILISTLPT